MSNIGNKEAFAKNLSYYLELCGRDQKEVAAQIGVAPSTFNEWIKAKKYPRIDKIEMLANYFGILKSDLIEEKNKVISSRSTTIDKITLLLETATNEQKEEVLRFIQFSLRNRK